MEQWRPPQEEDAAGFRSLVEPSRVLVVLLLIELGASVLMTAANLGTAMFYPGVDVDAFDDMAVGAQLLVFGAGLMAFPMLGAMLVALPVWLVWHHRAGANLIALGRADLAFAPAGHMGWWFVPFANLVLPYRCMEELYLRSPPDADAAPLPALFSTWWGCWLVSNIGSNVALRLGDDGLWLDVFATALGAGATLLYLRWVLDITRFQESAR